MATAYSNVTGTAFALNDLEWARFLYDRALTIRKLVLGPEHSNVRDLYFSDATAALSLRDSQAALERLEALAPHMIVAEAPARKIFVFKSMAPIYQTRGQWEQALKVYHLTLELQCQTIGDSHKNTSATVHPIEIGLCQNHNCQPPCGVSAP